MTPETGSREEILSPFGESFYFYQLGIAWKGGKDPLMGPMHCIFFERWQGSSCGSPATWFPRGAIGIFMWKSRYGDFLEGRQGFSSGNPDVYIVSRDGKDLPMEVQLCECLEGQQGLLYRNQLCEYFLERRQGSSYGSPSMWFSWGAARIFLWNSNMCIFPWEAVKIFMWKSCIKYVSNRGSPIK